MPCQPSERPAHSTISDQQIVALIVWPLGKLYDCPCRYSAAYCGRLRWIVVFSTRCRMPPPTLLATHAQKRKCSPRQSSQSPNSDVITHTPGEPTSVTRWKNCSPAAVVCPWPQALRRMSHDTSVALSSTSSSN